MKRPDCSGALIPLFILSLFLCGCNEDSDDPQSAVSGVPAIAMSPASALVSPQKLKEWIDNGYTDDWGYPVVILDTGFDWSYDTRPVYDAGHIPGARYVEVLQFYATRSDGVIGTGGLVPDGPHMDAFLRKHGIDKDTTIVLTGNYILGPARAYWALRYWGFARGQVFVLDGKANGGYSVWTAAGYELETSEPALPAPSDFSVGDWTGNMDETRASTGEFFRVAEGKVEDAVVLDVRTDAEWVGYVATATNLFGFRVKNSVWMPWGNFMAGGEEGTHRFKTAWEIGAALEYLGVTEDKTAYSFCQAGGRAAVAFLVFDGILGRRLKMYDGSSMELGQLGCLDDGNGGVTGLPEDSPWRFDLRKFCEVIAYNDPGKAVPPAIVNAYAESACAVNEEDKAYHGRPSSLLEPGKLKGWIDGGFRDDRGRRVVILDAGFDWSMDTRPVYDAGHIPGAYHVQPMTFYAQRSEGVTGFAGAVIDGPAMDALVRQYGIDGNTSVVFTGNDVLGAARAYWTFRYWGFPQEQLFILNGRANGEQSVWTAAGYELQTAEPPLPIPSTFSVGERPANMDNVRAATQEFMMAVEGKVPFSLVVDARSEGEWNAEVISPETNVFGFRVKGSVWKTWGDVLEGGEEGSQRFKSAAEIVEDFDGAGITAGRVPYVFCMAGGRAAVLFFAFEEILGRRVKMHDGSSAELGQMGHLEDGAGADLGLPEDSPWRFDTYNYCDEITYNDPAAVMPVVVIDAYAGAAAGINEIDKLYCRGD